MIIIVEFFYQPHTISLLFICVLALTYTAFTRDDSEWHNNILTGLIGVFIFFMIISILTLPNGPFTRPHPALWRCVLGVSILYLLLLQVNTLIGQHKSILISYWLTQINTYL